MKKLFLLFVALIVHFSLYPWDFTPLDEPFGPFLSAWSWPRGRADALDFVANVLLYMPLGALGVLARPKIKSKWWRWAGLAGGCTLMSLSLEMVQAWIPGRDSSVRDVVLNGLSTLAGIAVGSLVLRHWTTRSSREFLPGRGPMPMVLATAWLFGECFPFLPIMQLTPLRRSLSQLVRTPSPSWLELAGTFVGCLLLSCMLRGSGKYRHALPLVALMVFPMRIFIRGSALSWLHIATAVAAFALSILLLSTCRAEAKLLGALALVLIAARQFSPFAPVSSPSAFYFIPFTGFLGAGREAIRVMAQKFFLYGSSVWMLKEARLPLWASTSLVTLLLAAGEVTQLWLPGRTPESTDPLLALLSGLLLILLRDPARSEAATPTRKPLGWR